MGKMRQKGRRNRQRDQQNQPNIPYERQNYVKSPKTNKDFESYYQLQGIVPDGEWEAFLEALRRPLPATFRITGFKKQSVELLKLIQGSYFDKLVNVEVEGRVIEPPLCLPWYPDNLGWQLDMGRKFIRQCDSLKKLHNFLVEETESGNISRQEAVSMIPPLVLDVQPHHKVLDMCAAPGSKTSQLIEMLHSCDKPVPDGCVVGNDSDNKRCYLMTHQVKRLESASFIIINQDATCMPNFKLPNEEGILKSVRFDRVLADVPCSGDGTMRKNPDVWGKWNVQGSFHLHNLQSRILSRGLEMLVVGGRLVYSTCSLNPIEDEAVVSNLLRRSKGSVKLINISKALPGLKGMPGLSSWKVLYKEMKEYASVDDLPGSLVNVIRPSVFPPSEEEVKEFNLQRCVRILPHHQDTGCFFISVLEKIEELPWVTKSHSYPSKSSSTTQIDETNQQTDDKTDVIQTNKTDVVQTDKTDGVSAEDKEAEMIMSDQKTEGGTDSQMEASSSTTDKRKFEQRPDSPQQRKRKKFGYREDPFVFLEKDEPIWPAIRDFFKLDNFPMDHLLVRCTEGKKRNLYFASPIVKQLVTHNIDRMKFINLGLKLLSRSASQYVTCQYRTVQEGVAVLYPYVTDRRIPLTKEDIITLLSTEMPFLSRFSKVMQDGLSVLSQGSVLFVYNPKDDDRPDSPKCEMVICGWLGRTSCRSFIAINERGHYLRLCGSELQPKEHMERDKRPNGDDLGSNVTMGSNATEGSDATEVDVDLGSEVMDGSEVTETSDVTHEEECDEVNNDSDMAAVSPCTDNSEKNQIEPDMTQESSEIKDGSIINEAGKSDKIESDTKLEENKG